MTVKQFFQSKSFKCIIVLLCIALVAGGLLAILNDVLYVSDEEKTLRAIKEVYGTTVEFTDMTADFDGAMTNKYGTVNSVFLLSDNNYLIKATGGGGFKGGTVTVWCAVNFVSGRITGIKRITVEGNTKQTLMSQFTDSFFGYYTMVYMPAGEYDEMNNIMANATYTAKAINNAVNAAMLFATDILQIAEEAQ